MLNQNQYGGDSLDWIKESVLNGNLDDYERIYKFYYNQPDKYGFQMIPSILHDFMKVVAESFQGVKVLDSWMNVGELSYPWMNTSNKISAINNIPDQVEVAERLFAQQSDSCYELRTGDPIDELKSDFNVYDVVVSSPPFGNKSDHIPKGFRIRDYGYDIIIETMKKLDVEGVGFFLVPPSFLHKSSVNNVRKFMESQGFYLDAAFYLPPGIFKSTSIHAYLIVVRKESLNNLFIAELKSSENIRTVISNWKNRKSGSTLSLGYLTNEEAFTSFKNVEKYLEIKRLAKRSGLKPTTLNEFVLSYNRHPKSIDEEFLENYNSVFIPSIGTSDILTSLDESTLREKENYYMQLVLDPKKVNADYMANWFNTELGRLVRESMMTDAPFPTINILSLKWTEVYLPEIETQIETISTQSKINNLRADLDSIEDHLWKKPKSIRSQERRLTQLNREMGLVQWIDKLPFPLASILWKYHATKETKVKNEYLLHFFEALAQFEVVIMLSALADEESILGKLNLSKEKLQRSTFGSWVVIGERLAKEFRRLLSNEDEREYCLNLLKQNKTDLINSLISKKVFRILNQTCQYRNEWKGHGGAEGEAESKRRLDLLEVELVSLRSELGDVFEDYSVITPGSGRFKSGLFHCKCKLVMGTRTPFKDVLVKTKEGLEVNELYLTEEGNHEALKLLPFIRLMPSPQTQLDACYFYNRMDTNGVRMISYYFEQDADISIEDASFIQYLTDCINRLDVRDSKEL